MKQKRMIWYVCECGTHIEFRYGYIPEKFYCTTCEKEYTAKEMFKMLEECE